MPEGSVYVGRPTGYANPFKAGTTCDHQHAVDMFRLCTRKFPVDQEDVTRWRNAGGNVTALVIIAGGMLDVLRGKDLVCWCSLDEPCHADVLLELANR